MYENGDHPYKDLSKYGYEPYMKYKLFNQPFKFMSTLKTKYRNLAIFTIYII